MAARPGTSYNVLHGRAAHRRPYGENTENRPLYSRPLFYIRFLSTNTLSASAKS